MRSLAWGAVFLGDYKLLFLFDLGKHRVGDDTEDERGCNRGHLDSSIHDCCAAFGAECIRNLNSQTANTCDQNRGNNKQILAFVEIHVLDHLQTGNSDKAVQRQANTAHDARRDGLQNYHQRAEEGKDQAHDGCGGDGNHRGVTGDSYTTNRLTVGGIGADAEQRAADRAYTVTQQRAVQTGILDQIAINNGRKVLVVSNVLCKYDQGYGQERHDDCNNVCT